MHNSFSGDVKMGIGEIYFNNKEREELKKEIKTEIYINITMVIVVALIIFFILYNVYQLGRLSVM